MQQQLGLFHSSLLFARCAADAHTPSGSKLFPAPADTLQIDRAAQKNALASCSGGIFCDEFVPSDTPNLGDISSAVCVSGHLVRATIELEISACGGRRIYLATDADLFFVSAARSFVHLSQIA
jgi:hypothetical protein